MPTKRGQIANELREAILSGEYQPGSTLPPLPVLMERYGTARDTVRDAISALANEGLVTPRRGIGTVVRETMPVELAYSPTAPARTWAQQVSSQNASDIVINAGWDKADADIAGRLGVSSGTRVLHRTRHQSRGSGVAQIHEQWIPGPIAEAIIRDTVDLSDKDAVVPTDLFSLMRISRTNPAETTETIGARMPDPEEREVMGLPSGVPVLVTKRVTRDNDGQAVETSTMVGAADRMTNSFTMALR